MRSFEEETVIALAKLVTKRTVKTAIKNVVNILPFIFCCNFAINIVFKCIELGVTRGSSETLIIYATREDLNRFVVYKIV